MIACQLTFDLLEPRGKPVFSQTIYRNLRIYQLYARRSVTRVPLMGSVKWSRLNWDRDNLSSTQKS